MIKRFDLVGEYDLEIKEVQEGDYVLYEDYEKLAEENEALKQALEE